MIHSRGFSRRGEESRRQKERKSQDCNGDFFNFLLLGNFWFPKNKIMGGGLLQVPLFILFFGQRIKPNMVFLKPALREAQSAVLGAVTQRAFGDRSGVDAVGQK